MEEFLLTDLDFKLSYFKYGKGPRVVLALHGFDCTGKIFSSFVKGFEEEFTVYAINLLHHHDSTFPESRIETQPLLEKEWHKLLELLIQKENIHSAELMGYSLGGKMALSFFQHGSLIINGIHLIAPDGLNKNPWYGFASNTLAGRVLFKKVIRDPKIALKMANYLRRLGLIPIGMEKAAKFNLSNPNQREKLYKTWLTFRRIKPDLKFISENIKGSNIPLHIHFGKYDAVIPPKVGKKFIRLLGNQTQVHLHETGHNLVDDQLFQYMHKNTFK